jgi:glycyl-tRNA synthetase alpha chain
MEITQFTYFQQFGGVDMQLVPVELTYGLERIAMYVQKVDSVYDLQWVGDVKYGDIHHRSEVEGSTYNFELADTDMLFKLFGMFEAESGRVISSGMVLPAYDYVLKCSHTFNILDARNAISVTERTGYIGRVRALASACCRAYLAQREAMGFPLVGKFGEALPGGDER